MTQVKTLVAINDRPMGAAMVLAACLSFAAMLHHPSGPPVLGGLSQLVHGTLMVLLLIISTGFIRFAYNLGIGKPLVLGGLVAYASGIIAVLLAATINGFVVPAMAQSASLSAEIASLCWEFNQALAYASAFAVSGAYLLWGAEMLTNPRRISQIIGASGIAIGIGAVTFLATDTLDLHVAGAIIIYGAQWSFAAAIGLWLWWGSVETEQRRSVTC